MWSSHLYKILGNEKTDVNKFDISFSYKSEKFDASCSTFQVSGHHLYTMYRVVVPNTKNADVFVFYKIDDEKEMFTWYEDGDREDISASNCKGFGEIHN
jgi:hypothetical protein